MNAPIVSILDPDPCLSMPCDVNANCIRDGTTSGDFICTCGTGFTGSGLNCIGMFWIPNEWLLNTVFHYLYIVPDPCLSGPCDANASCERDGLLLNTFTCTCVTPFQGNGFSCSCKCIVMSGLNIQTYLCPF